MAETGKKVEVRYGAFSATIEGYDDPVGQMREVLALMQRMIAETPALADADSGLDDAQFARFDKALADSRTEADDRGVIVIRSGHRVAGDAEDAEVLADPAGRGVEEGATRRHWTGEAPAAETGPHPSAAIFSAPAAAVAEAAFAAGMAADDPEAPAGTAAEEPLGREEPGEAVTPAALYAAPAADVAEAAFPGDLEPIAQPADPDDDAGDTEVWADEVAAERAQDGALGLGPREAHDAAGHRHGDRADRDRGSPAGSEYQPEPDGGAPDDPWRAAWSHQASAAPQDLDGGREALPRVNIFAAPPDEAASHGPWPEPADKAAEDLAPGEPAAVVSLRRQPGAATGAATGGAAPRDAWRAAHERQGREEPDDLPDDELDDRADGGAGDWPSLGELRDRSEDTEADSTENRLAALITRYQSGVHGEQDDADPHAAVGGISAADLAERTEATEVADLLAASAAWLTLVGRRPQFSRREVMEVFETLPGDHPRTLEARIKGFGKLVRSGTLMLVDDGAFAMPPRERERFRALMDHG